LLTVMVLSGGFSFEREVSLASGRRACKELESQGIDTLATDTDHHLLIRLQQERPDAVLNLLHGQRGEDGTIAEILEMAAVPYAGPPPQAARLAFDKPTAKELVRRSGIATPASSVLPLETFQELGAEGIIAALVDKFGLPLVVKPARGGSALGLTIVHEAQDVSSAMVQCFAYSEAALIEKYVVGTEVALTIIEEDSGPVALPLVQIAFSKGHYDYQARYTAGEVEFIIPSDLPTAVQESARKTGIAIHQELGLRDWSRIDMVIDGAGTPNFLEATSCPGLTHTSAVPVAIAASGRILGKVLMQLVERSIARSKALS
jgi:D-alanine-D-alanine ligase